MKKYMDNLVEQFDFIKLCKTAGLVAAIYATTLVYIALGI